MAGITYLVDYENVNERGLTGVELLDESDCVYLFFTDYANKLSLEYLTDICAPVIAKKALTGKQSLDMSLASFLGYLIGVENEPGRKYKIISYDTGYGSVCAFWRTQFRIDDKVTRDLSIDGTYRIGYSREETINDLPVVDQEIVDELKSQIIKMIHLHGEHNRDNSYSILLSRLCEMLNGRPAYQKIKQVTKLKAYQILEQYFASIA